MADTWDIHQIEYRWDPVKDMSPVASSMPGEPTRGWDPLIRPWVRHPNVDKPSESVCYQIFSSGTAALAWRYRDWRAAERGGAAQGRPLVSRVLVGQASALTPDVAIALCRIGLPLTAGPRPGRVTADTVLPPLSVDELTELVRERALALDQYAAREKGLQQVVAAALSHPHTPLAIQLRDPFIFYAPQSGSQSLLLWGLWRIAWPLLSQSIAQRGWSFSTFELPMGDQDTSTLPEIVFRMTQLAPVAPPANARKEFRVRPGDPRGPAVQDPVAEELAKCLVAEYREMDGDEVEQLIANCSAGLPRELRFEAVLDALRAKWPPEPTSARATQFAPVSRAQEPAPATTGPAESDIEHADPSQPSATSRPPGHAQHSAVAGYADVDEYLSTSEYDVSLPGSLVIPEHQDVPERQGRLDYRDDPQPHVAPARFSAPDESLPGTGSRPGLPSQPDELRSLSRPRRLAGQEHDLDRRPGNAPRLDLDEVRRAGAGPHSVLTLLTRLSSETDGRQFHAILERLLATSAEFDERVAACRQMPGNSWYLPVFERHGYQDCVTELSEIFRILVIPDLKRSNAPSALSAWVRKAPPQVTAALLVAAKTEDEAKRSEWETFELMTQTLGPAGLRKLLEVSGITFDWPRPRRRSQAGKHGSRVSVFAKLLAFLRLKGD